MQTVWRTLAAIGVTGTLSFLVVAPFAWFESSGHAEHVMALPALEELPQEFPAPPPGPILGEPFFNDDRGPMGPGPAGGFRRPPPPRRENFPPRASDPDHSSVLPPMLSEIDPRETAR